MDPEPEVRFEAVTAFSALTDSPSDLVYRISSLLEDPDSQVSTRVASVLLRLTRPFGKRSKDKSVHEKARAFLRYTAAMGELSNREHAIMAMGDWGDAEAFDFLVNELKDRGLLIRIRRIILTALARIDASKSLPELLHALSYPDVSILETTADLLGQIGPPAVQPVLVALQNRQQEEGALLALQRLPMPPERPIEEYARTAVSRAVEYEALLRGVKSRAERSDERSEEHSRLRSIPVGLRSVPVASTGHEAVQLLIESLQKKSDEYGTRALRAIGLLGDRDAMNLAIDILETRNAAQRANVIEALESINARWRMIIQPLMRLWEEDSLPEGNVDWQRLLKDEDTWIRDCALFAAHKLGEMKMENIPTLSLMERILFLKRVPLFTNLSPNDIKQVAALVEEASFSNGDTLVEQGEVGDVMFMITSGEVRVITSKDQKELELGRRKAGEYVGEMALLSKEPRMATVTAVGNVHTLCIDQKSFESLLRDRPDASLAVIQVLCERLQEVSKRLHG